MSEITQGVTVKHRYAGDTRESTVVKVRKLGSVMVEFEDGTNAKIFRGDVVDVLTDEQPNP